MNRGRLVRYFLQAFATGAIWAAVAAALLTFAQVATPRFVWAVVVWILGTWAIAAIVFAPFERMRRRLPGPPPGPRQGEAGPMDGRQPVRGAWRPPDAA